MQRRKSVKMSISKYFSVLLKWRWVEKIMSYPNISHKQQCINNRNINSKFTLAPCKKLIHIPYVINVKTLRALVQVLIAESIFSKSVLKWRPRTATLVYWIFSPSSKRCDITNSDHVSLARKVYSGGTPTLLQGLLKMKLSSGKLQF